MSSVLDLKREFMIKRSFLFLLLLPFAMLVLQGCGNDCVIPDANRPQSATVRIVNAIPDFPTVAVYINGKLLNSAVNYFAQPTDATYFTTMSDGSSILAVPSRIVILSPSNATDTLYNDTLTIHPQRQTFVLNGRGHSRLNSSIKEVKIIHLLEGHGTAPTDHIRARFVHAMPDINALDLYFKYYANGDSIRSQRAVPDASMNFGDTTKYLDLPVGVQGLTVTEKGNPDHIVAGWDRLPGNSQFGLLATIVIRGEVTTLANDATASTLVLSDEQLGNVIYEAKFFYVRFINGLRSQLMHLLPKGPSDTGPRPDLIGQAPIECVGAETISDFAGLNEFYHGNAEWYFGNSQNCPPDTSHMFSYHYISHANNRYTSIAVEKSLFGVASIADSMVLHDTMTTPGSGKGRLRVVYINPDHSNATLTIDGQQVAMNYRDVKYLDLPAGVKTVTAGGETTTFTLRADYPGTLVVFPKTSAKEYPMAFSDK